MKIRFEDLIREKAVQHVHIYRQDKRYAILHINNKSEISYILDLDTMEVEYEDS